MYSLSSFFENKIDKSELSILLSIEKASIFLNEKLLNGGGIFMAQLVKKTYREKKFKN